MALPERPNLEPIELPEEPGLIGGWGRKLELTLLRFVLDTFNTIMTPFWDMRDKATNFLFQAIEEELKPVIEPLLDKIDAHEGVPSEIKALTQHLRFSEPITFAAIASSIIVAAIVGMAMGMMEPIRRLASQEVDSKVHSARMTPGEAFAALKRGAISEAEYHNHLSDGGWSEELEEAWRLLLAPLLGVGDLGQLYLRNELTLTAFNKELGKKGYTSEDATRIAKLLEVIPPITDIIRMAVREAFTPEIVTQFKLEAELPEEMVSWAKKQGLSREWAKAYWASHWQLPPLTLGYEMLHREVITQDEMEMLIKAHDISPYWRDKLVEISYSPYTRVDIRRMFNVGVVSQDEVYRNYRDIGYDHDKATKMTEFTVAASLSAERDLTKTEVLYGYEHGFFTPLETDEHLFALGYDQTEADFYKAKIDFKRWQKMVTETIKAIGQQYIANQISEQEVYAQMGALNLPAAQMNRQIREWQLKKDAKTKRLTADRLLKFRTAEVISDDEFKSEMSGLGYSARYIGWYLESIEAG